MNRQHPFAFIAMSLKIIFNSFFGFVIAYLNMKETPVFWLFPILIIVFILCTFLFTYLHWRNTYYLLSEQELHVHKGIFKKTKEIFPFIKIQGVHFSSNRLLEFLNLCTISIETAGVATGSSAKFFLQKDKAKEIQQHILYGAEKDQEEEEEKEKFENHYALSYKDLFLLGATSNAIFVGFALIVGAVSQVYEYLGTWIEESETVKQIEKEINSLQEMDLTEILSTYLLIFITIFFATLLLSLLFGILVNSLKYANFKVRRENEKIYISFGFWQTKNISIEVNRIQAIKIHQTIFQQMIGYAMVSYQSIGFDARGEKVKAILIPFAKKKDIYQLIQTIIPEYYEEEQFVGSPKAAKIRFIFRVTILPLLAVCIGGFFVPWIWYFGVLIPFFILLGYYRYKDNGLQVTDDKMLIQKRFFGKETIIILRHSIQSLDNKQTIFQKRKNLKHFLIAVATVGNSFYYSIKDMDAEEFKKIEHLVYKH